MRMAGCVLSICPGFSAGGGGKVRKERVCEICRLFVEIRFLDRGSK